MQVQVTGKHVDVGEALRLRVTDELTNSIGKYIDRAGGGADVVVSREGYTFKVDCALTLASGQQLQSHGTGTDAHTAFDSALQKIETRVRRYKRRLKDHHQQALAKQAETASYFVLRTPEGEDEPDWDDDAHQGSEGAPAAMVIAETERPIREMTVSMAVLELDMTGAQTIVFRNAAHGGLSVVYRRPDGNIGWIDPERTRPVNGTGSNGAA
ncbi:MAG: ribosome-associated translation inhibitor RaiA [Phenylobacterium sp.]|jgi:ribosomal subunit interface protein|uniref:ribosome hibernation-promoting factor, HPF/YfiA family n=1 Tax=Phenylobacterium sp. TaxID=1871053 RepID=UPI00273753A1|nr:ribosome-associated translation inhibitor RaiA [Phenylobacterium sp.]MBW0150315.1 ribosome-associated translation inhibitor RaiA [Phenylobacterium sp.]MDP1641298.1 ribosome-associated translation inhibitor RaiA [Phenylobacterium sp.]MDP3117632.1 ribosome-associated translation inhibitor RaiA [Phenylobacterium sp.]MDP3383212.1 ribosome-associated translation inhibitor RaiA [Phenylobacterium sp.]MDZ4053397.1 ribosome-associated translation inhibitor RaiA [Phenylobacterium sp.]